MPEMEEENVPEPGELVIVQLTRMEGVLNGVADKVNDLRTEVTQHRVDIAELKSASQTLREGFAAAEAKAVALAAALKDAEAERRNKSDQTWSPFAKAMTVIAVLVAIGSFYLQTPH